jgi:hypothetical protein
MDTAEAAFITMANEIQQNKKINVVVTFNKKLNTK